MDVYRNLNSAGFADFLLRATATRLQGANRQQEELIESQMEQLRFFLLYNTWVFRLELRKDDIMIKEMKTKISDLEKR